MSEGVVQKSECPQCGKKLNLVENGSLLYCYQCGYKQIVDKNIPMSEDAIRSLEFMTHLIQPDDNLVGTLSVDGLLKLEMIAAQEGNKDEAYFYLEWILRSGANAEQTSEAWLWLSKVYENEDGKRYCLEQSLAYQPLNPLARREMALLNGRLQPDEIMDPDDIQSQKDAQRQPQNTEFEHIQCPRCTGPMNYIPDDKIVVCEFCDFRQELDHSDEQKLSKYDIDNMEQNFVVAMATVKGHLEPISASTIQCGNCAVEFIIAPESLSIRCPYCDSVYVTETAKTSEILPIQALIPFSLNEEEVKRLVSRWLKKNHGLWRAYVTQIAGVYLPVWTFDIGGEMFWRGKHFVGERIENVNDSHYVFYDDVLIPAVKHHPKVFAEEMRLYDYKQLVAYDSRYLADWAAECYQVSLADASLQARKHVVDDIRSRPQIVTNSSSIINFRLYGNDMMVRSYKLILLPFWIVHYQIGNEIHDVIVNDRTGNIRDEQPQNVDDEQPRNVIEKLLYWLIGM